jgi:hypothetical protein
MLARDNNAADDGDAGTAYGHHGRNHVDFLPTGQVK